MNCMVCGEVLAGETKEGKITRGFCPQCQKTIIVENSNGEQKPETKDYTKGGILWQRP